MSANTVYFIEPPPPGDILLALAEALSKNGFHLTTTDKDILILLEMKNLLLEKGATNILSSQLLNEEILPDSTHQDVVLDTLKYKLSRCAPFNTLLIVDPYLYPAHPDADYISFFVSVFDQSLKSCSELYIATLSNRNATLEDQLDVAIKQINPTIKINKKYTDVFHDRFWIAEDKRGVFVGTSLNGIGKRYSIIDYLADADAKEIALRYQQL